MFWPWLPGSDERHEHWRLIDEARERAISRQQERIRCGENIRIKITEYGENRADFVNRMAGKKIVESNDGDTTL